MRNTRHTLALLLLLVGGVAAAQSPARIGNVSRFVAVADIHGAYEAFESILQQAGLIDEALAWSGGNDHLIVAGDVLDRGAESRRALDLIMRLEPAARAAGGGVHFVLGNHELMNLTGDLRYVATGEYSAFAPDETAQMRDAAFERYQRRRERDGAEAPEREEFDARFPPGFFAHRQAFSADGTYGAWLLGQPFLRIIDDWAFVHAGLAESTLPLLADDMNATLGRQLRDYVIALDTLTDAGVLDPGDNFYDHPEVLAAFDAQVLAGNSQWPEGTEAAARTVRELNAAFAFGLESPAWYRGNVGCGELVALDRIAATLAAVGVERLVVGHTPVFDATIHSRLDRQIYRIDTGMLTAYYGGRAAALIVEGTTVSAIHEDEAGPTEVEPEPRHVGRLPAGLARDELADFLATASVSDRVRVDDRWSRVTLRRDGIELAATFTVAESDDVRPELAAWRLDRLLGLDMVPVTVARELEGESGTLQFLPGGTITEAERQAQSVVANAWCPLGDQYGAMYIFDALIGNEGRTLDRMLYSTESFQLILVGHDLAFSTRRSIPEHLAEIALPLTPLWLTRLRALTEADLETAFDDVLDRRRIRALIRRRDRMLEDAGVAVD